MNKYNLTIKCDYFCKLDLDSFPYTIVRKGEDCIIEVSEGLHTIKCTWTTNSNIFIFREIDVAEHTMLEISFEDYIFEHPEVIKTADDFFYCKYNFPRFKAAWAVFDDYDVDEGCLDDAIRVKKDGVTGYVDCLGREALDYYYVIKDGNKYGFAHGLDRVVVTPIYPLPLRDRSDYDYKELSWEEQQIVDEQPSVLSFSGIDHGIGLVYQDEKWGFINLKDSDPEVVLYDNIYSYGRSEDIELKNNELFGIYNIKKGREVVPCLYDRVDRDGDFYIFRKNDKFGVLDINGTQITEPLYDKIIAVSSECLLASFEDGDSWMINTLGEKISVVPVDKVIAAFYEHIIVETNQKYGVVDINGQVIIPCEYNNIGTEHISKLFCIEEIDDEDTGDVISFVRVFETEKYKYYIVEKDGMVGVMSLKGEELLPCVYDVNDYEVDKLLSIIRNDTQQASNVDAVDEKIIPLSPDFYLKQDNEGWKIFDYEGRQVNENVYEDCVVEYGKVSVARNGFYREICRKDAKLVGYYYPYPPSLSDDALSGYDIDRDRDDETYWVDGYDTIIDTYGNVVWRRE